MAGLILAVGMMIDNSIIVTENITQYRHRGDGLMDACVQGTNEMITPMLSSSLTTIAVFVPLIFMSGIAGAIFSDQAFSITAGLAVSYIVGITLLPVLYYLFENKKSKINNNISHNPQQISSSTFQRSLAKYYDRGMVFCFRHKWVLIVITLLTVPLCVMMFMVMRQERMPEIDSNETIARIDWNENISLDANRKRVETLKDSMSVINSAYIGTQDYLLSSDFDLSTSESELYFMTARPEEIAPLQQRLADRIRNNYPDATVSFHKVDNIFEKIFSTDEAEIEVRISSPVSDNSMIARLSSLRDKIGMTTSEQLSPLPLREQIDISVDRTLLSVYNVDYSEVQRTLRTAFKSNTASTLRSYQEYTPIEIAGREKTVNDILNNTFVRSRADKDGSRTEIPLRSLVSLGHSRDLKTITAGVSGEYVPMGLEVPGREEKVMESIRETVTADGAFDVEFAGSFFSNARMMKELTVILLVSVMLMYFILCAQFESFLQSLIVLLEIPVDTFFAMLSLMIFGQSLNLMSAIGIIVTCGIVVNDSILKIDTINELRKTGMPLEKAIHTAGQRRLSAIIMTSLTTIIAMVPVLFTSDMGSELQRPMAIAMIGSMLVGTLVSIFIIPLFYWLIYRKHENS